MVPPKEKGRKTPNQQEQVKGENSQNATEGVPPTKKAKITQKNESKTPSRKKKAAKKPGNILLVTSGPLSPSPRLSSPSLSPEAPPLPPKPTEPVVIF